MTAEKHLIRKVKLVPEGSYELSFPWIQNNFPSPTFRIITVLKLKNYVESQKKTGILEEYEVVLKKWIQGGVIQEAKDSRNHEGEHYLPHRNIMKENSSRTIRIIFDGSSRETNSPSINDCYEKRS